MGWKNATPLPDIEYLRKIFEYIPETGILVNKVTRGTKAKVGEISGYISRYKEKSPRCRIEINKKRYFRSRLVYFMMSGQEIPPGMEVDHINGDSLDDHFENLRIVTSLENLHNRGTLKRGTLTLLGTTPRLSKKTSKINGYRALINLNINIHAKGYSCYLGCREQEIDAHLIYILTASYFFKEFSHTRGSSLVIALLPDLSNFTNITAEQLIKCKFKRIEFRRILDIACKAYWDRVREPCPFV